MEAMEMKEIEAAVEGILFASGEPVAVAWVRFASITAVLSSLRIMSVFHLSLNRFLLTHRPGRGLVKGGDRNAPFVRQLSAGRKYIYITMKTTVCKAIFADFSIKSQKTDARLTKKQACFCISCQFLRNTAV